jgi:hypothetical protein
MILDSDFIQPGFLSEQGRAIRFLKVDEKEWERQLFRAERWENALGCGGYVFMIFGTLFLAMLFHGWLFYIGLSLSIVFIIWKTRQINKYTSLKAYADTTFVIFDNRVVRYTLSNYQIFYFSEVSDIRFTPYGIHLWKTITWREWLRPQVYDISSTKLLVLPNATENYVDIEPYIERMKKAEVE